MEPELRLDAVADSCDAGGNAEVVDHGSGDVGGTVMALENCGGVEWDNLQIVDTVDEEGEGRLVIIDEDNVLSLLGLRTEDDEHQSHEHEASAERDNRPGNRNASVQEEIDTAGAAIPVEDHVPGERTLFYDPNKPCMKIGTVYPNMKEFRLAMRQFAINEEFELHIAKTDPVRYIGDCNVEGCPWHIVGRRQPDGVTVKVLNYWLTYFSHLILLFVQFLTRCYFAGHMFD